jgi:hypothetical protein
MTDSPIFFFILGAIAGALSLLIWIAYADVNDYDGPDDDDDEDGGHMAPNAA